MGTAGRMLLPSGEGRLPTPSDAHVLALSAACADTSSFFGDELWAADKLSFAQQAMNAAPSPVALILVSAQQGQ